MPDSRTTTTIAEADDRRQEPDGPVCTRCGNDVGIVWWTSNTLWAVVVQDAHGPLCPVCFSECAKKKGLSLRWEPFATIE